MTPPASAVQTLATYTPTTPAPGLDLLYPTGGDATSISRADLGDIYPDHTRSWLGPACYSDYGTDRGGSSNQPSGSHPDSGGNEAHPSSPHRHPFNPASAIAPKVLKKIIDLENVKMADVVREDAVPLVPGRPTPAITNISTWMERYSIMVVAIATRFLEKAPDLFAYQATIIRNDRNYEVGRWVAYDRLFRRGALARTDLNWSIPDQSLYNMAFTGRAKLLPRCTRGGPCGSILSCKPEQAVVRMAQPATCGQAAPLRALTRPPPQAMPSSEVCRRYNESPKVPLSDMHVETVPVHTQQSLAPLGQPRPRSPHRVLGNPPTNQRY